MSNSDAAQDAHREMSKGYLEDIKKFDFDAATVALAHFRLCAHREKSKAYLEDIKKCRLPCCALTGTGAVLRRQLRDFNAWFDDWGIDFPRCAAEADDERAAFLKMGMDNPYYLDWVKRITTWEPVVLDPFCHACALWHGKVSWCKGCDPVPDAPG